MTAIIEIAYVFVLTLALILVVQRYVKHNGDQVEGTGKSRRGVAVVFALIMVLILRTDEIFANFLMSVFGA